MLSARVIPCLDVHNGRLVKGVNFVNLVDAGDPVEQARIYDAAGADELCFLDDRSFFFIPFFGRDEGARLQEFFELLTDTKLNFCIGFTTSRFLLEALDATLYGFKIGKNKLGFDGFDVAEWIHRFLNVGDVGIVEAANHMQYGIDISNVAQEFVAEAFTLGGAFYKTRNINNLNRCGDHLLGGDIGLKRFKSWIGNGNHTDIRLDGAKRVVCRLGFG